MLSMVIAGYTIVFQIRLSVLDEQAAYQTDFHLPHPPKCKLSVRFVSHVLAVRQFAGSSNFAQNLVFRKLSPIGYKYRMDRGNRNQRGWEGASFATLLYIHVNSKLRCVEREDERQPCDTGGQRVEDSGDRDS